MPEYGYYEWGFDPNAAHEQHKPIDREHPFFVECDSDDDDICWACGQDECVCEFAANAAIARNEKA